MVPWWAWLTLFVAVICLLPVGVENGYVRRVAFDTVVFMLLALGLNIVVGWGGLLDLGYVAFFGIGAYAYALLSSDQYDLHLPTLVVILLVAMVGGLAGWLVGLPSRRLTGDYLAIVTLFFFQAFLTVTNNGDDVFGRERHERPQRDPQRRRVRHLRLGRSRGRPRRGSSAVGYLYVALVLFAVVYVALHLLNDSRTGRAWRSLREDALAAEVMGMPVNALKLMAFAFGAAVAALTGTFATALNGSVFPQDFEFPLLIAVYTMVILGGAGSQAGVVLGAIIVSVLLEALREPGDARGLFYGVMLLALSRVPKRRCGSRWCCSGHHRLGVVARAVAQAIDETWTSGRRRRRRPSRGLGPDWVIVPQSLAGWVAPVSYITLIGARARPHPRGRLGADRPDGADALPGGVRLGERDAAKPEPTRYMVLGAILVATMVARPNGLLGEKRVEII